MIKILQILSHLKQNGTETFVMNIFRNIDRDKYMFDFLVTTDDKGGFYDEIISLGGTVFSIRPRREGFIRYHNDLDKFFKTYGKNYHAVHMHTGSLSSVAPLYYAKKYHIPIRILHSHSSNCTGLHNRILHYANRLRLKSIATHYFACSEKAREWAFKYSGIYASSTTIINGIDTSRFLFNPSVRSLVRTEMDMNNKFIIGHIGSFNAIKNHAFLIDVFSEIHRVQPQSALFLVGDGPLISMIKDKVNSLNLQNNVIFLGRRNDVNNIMQALDVMVMPSLFEGLPFTLIEAQASSLPVVASTGVPVEVKASECFESISLDDNISEWVAAILKYQHYHRTKLCPTDEANKYSISNTITQITNVYPTYKS